VLEQVSYFGAASDWAARPAVVQGFGTEGFDTEGALFYGLPTPGVGYKVGIDRPLRRLAVDDLDRTPSAERVAETESLVARVLPGLEPSALHSEVCSWTSSPDEGLVLDRVGDVVVGCGDSGQAFKFSPLIGEILADLAEGRAVDDDVARLGLARFG
jgi:glycine/D-amino acid oxidase-like deaminating enzyme